MSTKPTPNAQTRTSISQPITRIAPLTWDPHNTNPTPDMFEDKWRAASD